MKKNQKKLKVSEFKEVLDSMRSVLRFMEQNQRHSLGVLVAKLVNHCYAQDELIYGLESDLRQLRQADMFEKVKTSPRPQWEPDKPIYLERGERLYQQFKLGYKGSAKEKAEANEMATAKGLPLLD